MRHPLPQLRIIQQQFDRPTKRPYSKVASPQRTAKAQISSGDDDEDDDDDDDDDEDPNSRFTRRLDDDYSSTSERPTKIRKKPGRKPNPASPAVRKEQNRAAQRAFRDRKERHLQEMENTIKELRETNSQITQRLQQDAQQFQVVVENLQRENYYLRHVVFSFETALTKGGNIAVLQEVKAELYDRHYEKHTTKKASGTSSPSPPSPPSPSSWSSPSSPSSPPTPPATSIFSTKDPIPFTFGSEGNSWRTQEHTFNHNSVSAKNYTSAMSAIPSSLSTPSASSSPQPSISSSPPATYSDPRDDNMFSVNNAILYTAPSLIPVQGLITGGSLSKSITTPEPLPVPRSPFTDAKAYHIKGTEYTKPGNVFDELQSSLFPPGTLQSIIHSGLATPQEIVNDISLLDQLQDHRPLRDPVISPRQAAITFSPFSIDTSPPSAPTSVLDDDDSIEFEIATSSLGLDDGLKQAVPPTNRLQREVQVLASAPPAVDIAIDPKIYAIPHDPRIDLIPCPKLRAQMILHQKSFDVDAACQVLVNGAICHGHPLDPHSWELPEEFFDRYGFLLGEEMLRHRNKVWPKKDGHKQGTNGSLYSNMNW
ncbi:hypothetical protein BGZ99_003580 [Dissophora globulifera]|uniref:BZIP domain-containing protein n=1 Tax=Dissophora globulifera TaxID=979702 RepID=A0A9P6UVU4_9FUNG|nr:hypothetical protein BGZ99_003580 [Dissophora globulifera]